MPSSVPWSVPPPGRESEVVMETHVAQTAPMTMVPIMTMESRSAVALGPTSASTAAPPRS